jgi:hypothetical protein
MSTAAWKTSEAGAKGDVSSPAPFSGRVRTTRDGRLSNTCRSVSTNVLSALWHAPPVAVEAPVEQDAAAKDLAAFYSLGRELAVPGGVSDIGAAIWGALSAELGAVSCVLFVYDESGDALAPAFRAGVETVPPDARVSLGDRLSGWVAATRTPIVNSDARLDVDPMLRDESPLQSALAVPIGTGEQLGGVLAFYSDRQAAFTPVHQRMAEAVAALVAERVCAGRAELLAVPAGVARNSTPVSRH